MGLECKPVKELPRQIRATQSEYDNILDRFLKDAEIKYAEVTKDKTKPGSLIAGLKSRIDVRKLKGLKVRTINERVYLVKEVEEKKPK